MAFHAHQIDVWEGYEVQRYWVVAPNDLMAIMAFKKAPSLPAKATLKLKGKISDAVANELGLDLAAAGTYGRLDPN